MMKRIDGYGEFCKRGENWPVKGRNYLLFVKTSNRLKIFNDPQVLDYQTVTCTVENLMQPTQLGFKQ